MRIWLFLSPSLLYFILFYFSQRVSLSSARQEIFEKIKYEVLYILCLYMALFDFRVLWSRLFLWNCLLSFPFPHSSTLYCVSLLHHNNDSNPIHSSLLVYLIHWFLSFASFCAYTFLKILALLTSKESDVASIVLVVPFAFHTYEVWCTVY